MFFYLWMKKNSVNKFRKADWKWPNIMHESAQLCAQFMSAYFIYSWKICKEFQRFGVILISTNGRNKFWRKLYKKRIEKYGMSWR